jgi:hypothetical protein
MLTFLFQPIYTAGYSILQSSMLFNRRVSIPCVTAPPAVRHSCIHLVQVVKSDENMVHFLLPCLFAANLFLQVISGNTTFVHEANHVHTFTSANRERKNCSV